MSNKFVSILEAIGKDFEKGLLFVIRFLPPVESLAALLFPAAVAPLTVAEATAGLLQNAIVVVEQRYAASGVQTGTGQQKAAEVLALAGQAVTTLLADPTAQKELAAAGITVNDAYIQNLVAAIVGFLNVQGVTGTASLPVPRPLAS